MRIITGKYRGHRLKSVPGDLTRPTSDKIKGAIFNVLQDKVENARVLDLFAGTGNLSFESISRGAREAVLVEKNRIAQKVIRENMAKLGVKEVQLVPTDAFSYLGRMQDDVFDLIFLDPPYHKGLVEKCLNYLAAPCRLSYNGVIVAETASDEMIPEIQPFEIRKTGEYGDTKIWYLQRIH